MNRGRMKNLSGLVASPLATLREGLPIAFRWVISSVVKPGGSEGPSPEEAHGRIEFDLRQLVWSENEFCTEWQSYAALGGAMGVRTGATKTRLGQFTTQREDEVRAYSGFVDFPVRYEIKLRTEDGNDNRYVNRFELKLGAAPDQADLLLIGVPVSCPTRSTTRG